LAVYLDAIAAYGFYCSQVQGRVDTAMLVELEDGEQEGWRGDHASRTLRENWGVVDQEGVYLVAGLTKAEREVAFLHYDRQLDSGEIGRLLNRSAITVRVQLHKAEERLQRLAVWDDSISA
jgi:DNA-directed RNA polymerase specialized sigma24 family protein